MVRGMVGSPALPEPPRSRGLKALWKQFWNTESDVPSELASVAVERIYYSSDVDRLDAEGKSHRVETHDRAEPDSTQELLRVLAAYCEAADLHLLSVSKQGRGLNYVYLTRSGRRETGKGDFSNLRDFAYGMRMKRRKRGLKGLLRFPAKPVALEQVVSTLTTPTDNLGL